MRIVFGDTSFFVALLNPNDGLFERANRVLLELHPVHMVTSEMVFTELLNDSSQRGDVLRHAAVDLVDQIRADTSTNPTAARIVPQTADQFQAALNVFRDRPDKSWSLTDCASYLIMVEHDIHDALTHDRHFEQMGFRALLRS